MRVHKYNFDGQVDRYNLEKILFVIICMFLLGNTWVNFCGRQWYSMDIYTDAYFAKLVAENNTIFPQGWVFGNQYYGFATPVVAALIYKIIPNSFYAMAIATTIMTTIIIGLFVWCFKPYNSRKEIMMGIFAMVCMILGVSAAADTQGVQLFYTMASFYASYLIGILLTLGVYLRLISTRKINVVLWSAVFVVNYALGINSLRELLVLSLPLLAVEFLREVRKIIKKMPIDKYAIVYTLISGGAEILGIMTVKLLKPASHPIIANVELVHNLEELSTNFQVTLNAILGITGLNFFMRGIKWLPLCCIAMFIVGIVICAITRIIRKRDKGILSIGILFCCISFCAVAAVGVFLMPIRQIYLFVWYLLVALCVMYVYRMFGIFEQTNCRRFFSKSNFLIVLCLIGFANFIFNFFFCFYQFSERDNVYRETAQRILDDDIENIWVFPTTSPTVAIYSNDEFSAGTVTINEEWKQENKEKILKPLEYLRTVKMYETSEEYVYWCSSVWDEAYLDEKLNEDAKRYFMDQAEFVDKYSYSNIELTLYKIPKDLLDFSVFEEQEGM